MRSTSFGYDASVLPSRFPDPRRSRSDIIALGADLTPDTLRDAYRHGIFPWPHDGLEDLPWFSPRRRAVIFFDQMHVGRSLRKVDRRHPWRLTIDTAFERVIRACAAAPRPDQDGTWIEDAIIAAYVRLHEQHLAHSVEAWDGDELIGGLYGVDAGGVFTGESMFHHRSDASKIALLYLINHLRARGCHWLDCQVMTPHMEALGATLIPRSKFLDLLVEAQDSSRILFDPR